MHLYSIYMDTYDINPKTHICIYMHIFYMCVYIETGYSICRAVIFFLFCRFKLEFETTALLWTFNTGKNLKSAAAICRHSSRSDLTFLIRQHTHKGRKTNYVCVYMCICYLQMQKGLLS